MLLDRTEPDQSVESGCNGLAWRARNGQRARVADCSILSVPWYEYSHLDVVRPAHFNYDLQRLCALWTREKALPFVHLVVVVDL